MQQIDDVVIINKSVRKHHERFRKQLLARSVTGRSAGSVSVSLILQRKTKTTCNDVRRHVNQRSTERERTRAKHQKCFFRWDAKLNLHDASGLMYLKLVCRTGIGVVGEQVVAGDQFAGAPVRLRRRRGAPHAARHREADRGSAVDVKHANVDCPDSQRKCKYRADAAAPAPSMNAGHRSTTMSSGVRKSGSSQERLTVRRRRRGLRPM